MSIPSLPENPSARQLGDALLQAADEFTKIRRTPVSERSAEQVDEARALKQFIEDVDIEHKARSVAERATYVPASNGPVAALDQPAARERSLGEMVVEDEGFKNFLRSGSPANGKHRVQLDTLNERALVDSTTTGAGNGGLWVDNGPPRLPQPQGNRRLFLRALLGRITTTGNGLTYMQETNTATNDLGATVVAEGAAKPEVSLEWVQTDAPIRKIAAWIPLTTEIIEDAPALRGYIDNRLLYMLNLREELEFLDGDGTGAHILGIRQTTGTQTQAAIKPGGVGTATDIPATVAAAIGKIENVDGDPDGVVMNPLDYWSAVATRWAAQQDNAGGGNAPSAASNLTWGLPVVRTRGIEQGAALVGGFRMGATVIDRTEAQIDVGNQHLDYFTTNRVAVRAEKRVGLAVDRPSNFVEVTGI